MIFTRPNEDNLEKYGRNFPYYAWKPEVVNKVISKKTQAQRYACTGDPKIVYSGRFCAVSGFIYAIVNGKYSILANLRGSGTPDYQGCWNAICGYLERYESAKEGIARETLEECGFQIDTDDLREVYTETNPKECNNGNVTIRHIAFLGKIIPHYVNKEGGEENEVESVKWIPIDKIDNYKWAFNHYNTIQKYSPKKWKRKIIEFYYKWFNGYNKTYTDEFDIMKEDIGY